MNESNKMLFALTALDNEADYNPLDKNKETNSSSVKMLAKMRNISDLALGNILLGIGILPNRCGYHYLKEAVLTLLFVGKETTYKLYNRIGKKFNCSPASIERAIRHAVSQSYNMGKLKSINKLFSVDIVDNYHLTNTEIIALLVQYIQEKKPWQE